MNPNDRAFHIRLDRRTLLRSLLLATGGALTGDLFAEATALTRTPWQTEGPYYPDHLPLDQDNDLLQISGDSQRAAGVVTNFGGRLLNADGKPIEGANVELWQADDSGCYIHSRGEQRGKKRDAHFQGFGKITTNAKGEYRFRTIKPGLYTGRTRHYHIAVVRGGKRVLTTQLYLAGEPQNDRDGILRGIRDEAQRLSVIREFKAMPGSNDELVAAWDIVLGATPSDDHGPGGPGGPPPGGRRGPGGPGGPLPRDGQRPPPPPQ